MKTLLQEKAERLIMDDHWNQSRRMVKAEQLAQPVLSIDGLRLHDRRNADADHAHTESRNHTGSRKLQLSAGTLTLILGPNGAGKTVFLEKTAGLRDPEQLTISYQDEPLWLGKPMGRGRRLNPRVLLYFGFASQAPEDGLFQRSLEKELAFSLRPYVRQMDAASMKQEVHQALTAVGWDESWLARDPRHMSGGERRRAALAALFVTPAPWLLLDEPTAGLDREGQERLAIQLNRLKQEGKGILLISHETDWALPLADQVLLFHPDREVHLCTSDQLIAQPELLEQAGMKVPVWLKVMHAAMPQGGDEPFDWRHPARAALHLGQAFGHTVGHTPGNVPNPGMHDHHTKQLQLQQHGHVAGGSDIPNPASHRYISNTGADTPHEQQRPTTPAAHPLTRFDPRSVWLGYILLSVSIFTLSSWTGLAIAALVVLALMAVGRIPLLRWKGILTGFVVFGAGFAALNAVRLAGTDGGSGIGWDPQAFFQTLFPFARTMTVLLLGLGLPLIWTPLSVRKALEQLGARKGIVPAFWQRNVLIITLTLRFIPVLLKEWERFGRIYLARGKETRKTPAAILRRLRGSFLPLLLALIRIADDTAAALESRGIRRDATPVIRSRLRWKYRDYAVAAGAILLAAIFIMLD